MIKEDYVSFETAKLLKEKGFDEYCLAYYNTDNGGFGMDLTDELWNNTNNPEYIVSAPTLQMAMKWLREVKHYYIDIHNYDAKGYTYELIDLRNIYHLPSNDCYKPLETYEQACEAAIKYCLENLI